jgi:D-arabinose 1-dehydrogenase-like Zn-dependent alcohol dehydrogenase
LEREFKIFKELEGGVCTMCAPRDRRKSSDNQAEQAELNGLRFHWVADISEDVICTRQAIVGEVGEGANLTDAYINVSKAMTRHPGARVLVWGGCGKLGPYSVDHAFAAGAVTVDYIDRNSAAREIARGLGARVHVEFDPSWKRQYPVVIFAGTSPSSLKSAFIALSPGGHLSQLMIFFQDTAVPMMEIYMRDVTFSNGRPSTRPHIPAVLELCRCGKLHPENVVSKVIAWDDAPEALLEPQLNPVIARQPILSSRRFSCLPA